MGESTLCSFSGGALGTSTGAGTAAAHSRRLLRTRLCQWFRNCDVRPEIMGRDHSRHSPLDSHFNVTALQLELGNVLFL